MKFLIFIVILILCGLVLFGCPPAQSKQKPAYGEEDNELVIWPEK